MKTTVVINRALMLMLSILFPFIIGAAETTLPACDLGAEMITFEILQRVDACTIRVKVTGKIKNLGAHDYSCGAGQTMAQLYEGSPTQDNTFTLVAEKELRVLPVGEFFNVEYERNWDTGDLNQFAGSPCYRLEIKYAPGLQDDNIPENDDQVVKNNKRERTTKQLRRIWAFYSKK